MGFEYSWPMDKFAQNRAPTHHIQVSNWDVALHRVRVWALPHRSSTGAWLSAADPIDPFHTRAAMRKSNTQLWPPISMEELDGVRTLFTEYAASLNVDLCFQNFNDELTGLPGEYRSPRGSLVVATVDGQLAGCCAMRPLDSVDYPNACEMKRLYVRPTHRGLGLGRLLAEHILEASRLYGYASILLDTLNDMESARALYQELGFEEIPPYYYNPIPGAHYLKAEL